MVNSKKIEILEQIIYSANAILKYEKSNESLMDKLEDFKGKPIYDGYLETIENNAINSMKERLVLIDFSNKFKELNFSKQEITFAYNFINAKNLYPDTTGSSRIYDNSLFDEDKVIIRNISVTDIKPNDSIVKSLKPKILMTY
jgi:hypothetical protein